MFYLVKFKMKAEGVGEAVQDEVWLYQANSEAIAIELAKDEVAENDLEVIGDFVVEECTEEEFILRSSNSLVDMATSYNDIYPFHAMRQHYLKAMGKSYIKDEDANKYDSVVTFSKMTTILSEIFARKLMKEYDGIGESKILIEFMRLMNAYDESYDEFLEALEDSSFMDSF